jgi:hypothetical protein
MKSETEEIFYGKQPNWKHWKPEDYKDEDKVYWSIALALNWYNTKFTDRDYKASVIEYMEKNKIPGVDMVAKVPVDNFTFRVIGGKCQANLCHCILPIKIKNAVKEGIEQLIILGKTLETTNTPIVPVRERVRQQSYELGSILEQKIDEYEEYILGKKPNYKLFNIENWINENEPSAMHCEFLLECFERGTNEFKLVVDGKDDQLKEAYSFLTKKQAQKMHDFYKSICDHLRVRITIAKSNRKPRKKKKKKPEQLVKKLKYLVKDNTTGIESILPDSIIGSQTVIVFNTKTNKASMFKADSNGSGLSVKGSTIIGFSTESVEKKMRKPVEFMTKAKSEGIRSINNYWKSQKTKESQPKGRINAHTLILKSFK